MADYVSRVNLEINGQNITDFASVEENEYEIGKMVKLMNKTGFTSMYPRYGAKVDYVIPADSPEFDFTTVQNGTLTIDYLNGTRITYTGVSTLKVNSTKHDGEKESTRNIEFVAQARIPETAMI